MNVIVVKDCCQLADCIMSTLKQYTDEGKYNENSSINRYSSINHFS
jgi:hypothetical protein